MKKKIYTIKKNKKKNVAYRRQGARKQCPCVTQREQRSLTLHPNPHPGTSSWNQKGMRKGAPVSEEEVRSPRAASCSSAAQRSQRTGLHPGHRRRAEVLGGRGPWLMLHNDQSCPGIPMPPGSRTGTHPLSAPWQASGSEAPSLSGKCPPRPRSASAQARCSG